MAWPMSKAWRAPSPRRSTRAPKASLPSEPSQQAFPASLLSKPLELEGEGRRPQAGNPVAELVHPAAHERLEALVGEFTVHNLPVAEVQIDFRVGHERHADVSDNAAKLGLRGGGSNRA